MARGDWIIDKERFAGSRQQSQRDRLSPRVCGQKHGARDTRLSGCEKSADGGREGQIAEVQHQCHSLYSDMDITLPLCWESMVRSCRGSLDALEFEFNRAHAAQEADSLSQDTDAACVSHADEPFYKGQLLPLHPCPRTTMVERLSDGKREGREILQEGNSRGEAQGLNRAAAYSDFSPASLSHLFQPRYSKFCLKSPHDAPVETVLDSRSSSFRSQSSGIAWETSGDKDSGADTSSPDSTISLQDSMCFNRDQRGRVSTEEPNPFNTHQAGLFIKDCSKDYENDKKQAAETRTSALSTLLRPWKALFGTKKSSKHRSREAEYIESLGSRLSDASSPIISWSAPLQRTAPFSPIKNEQIREKNNCRSVHEAPLAAAPTTAEADEQPVASAAGDKDRTLRLLRRELSLQSHIRNSSRLLPPDSANAKVQKEPRLTHSQSAVMSSSASPGWCRLHHEDCATPKLPSREHWKKYVKMLNPLYPKTSQHTHEPLCKIDNIRINPASSSSSSSAAAAAAATNTPLGTPSRKSYGSSLPTIKLQTSSSESSTKAAAATGSKISRIIASSGMTPRPKSVNPTHTGMPAARTTVNQSTISEQHNAVQGAIAHCKQSNSGLLLRSTSS